MASPKGAAIDFLPEGHAAAPSEQVANGPAMIQHAGVSSNAGSGDRILIVDDHALVRAGLADLIEREPNLEVCGQAEGVVDALAQAKEGRPDLVIVDLSLKDGHGLDLIRELRELDSEVRILVLSMHDERLYAERALSEGAAGFVNKHEPPDKVVGAIRQVLGGRTALSPRMSDRLLRRLAPRPDSAARGPMDLVSEREREVLQLIGHGMNAAQIAARLSLSAKTVDTYREHIQSKLNLGSANELLRYAVTWTLDEGGERGSND